MKWLKSVLVASSVLGGGVSHACPVGERAQQECDSVGAACCKISSNGTTIWSCFPEQNKNITGAQICAKGNGTVIPGG